MATKRQNSGRFANGNAGGPGRPRRAIERDYLVALADIVPPETWKQVCQRALDDALQGDGVARAWLARYLIGEDSPRLIRIAADEERGRTSEAEIAERAKKDANHEAVIAAYGPKAP
jgi:hypothetical protein